MKNNEGRNVKFEELKTLDKKKKTRTSKNVHVYKMSEKHLTKIVKNKNSQNRKPPKN